MTDEYDVIWSGATGWTHQPSARGELLPTHNYGSSAWGAMQADGVGYGQKLYARHTPYRRTTAVDPVAARAHLTALKG